MNKNDPIELVIFDCDGVLVDSEILANFLVHQELLLLGSTISLDEYMEIGIGSRRDELTDVLKNRDIHLPHGFWEKINVKLYKAFADQLQVIDGVKHALNTIKHKKCVASNSPGKKVEFVLELTGIKHHFEDALFHGEMVTFGKPAPDLFLLAAKTFNVPPSRCLVIEDSVLGMRAGIAAGMRVWGFTGGGHCIPTYLDKINKENIDFVFHDMSQLASLIENVKN